MRRRRNTRKRVIVATVALASAVLIALTAGLGGVITSVVSSQGSCHLTGSVGSMFQCALGTLNPGQTATISVVAVPTSPGVLTNTASATTDTHETNLGNNSDTVQTIVHAPVATPADLSVTKTANHASVSIGSPVVYTIHVVNHGPANATGVTASDRLPLSATVDSVTSSQGNCSLQVQTVTCEIGSLNVGSGATIRITVTPTTVGFIRDTVCVSGDQLDSNQSNNHASVVTEVTRPQADIEVHKTGPATADQGSPIQYKITVTNNGPDAANGVLLNDQMSHSSASPSIDP